MGDAAPRGQRATEGADHGLQVQVLIRELLRGRAADHPGPLPGCVSGDRDTATKRRLQESNSSPSRGDQTDMLVWNSPRREGMLPAGDKRGNWNVTWFPADVWPGLGMYSRG